MEKLYPNRHIMCIDLKSFFASCECIERGLDPFKVPLVVANKNQGNGAITLAVTPYLKKQGVASRSRLYDIPKNIKYTIVPPRMKLYIEKSKEVVGIYLDYVAPEDLHVYSIDECFLDVTDYLKLYKKSDYELALEIIQKVYDKTGLTVTCGIGPNLLLAKVAMDIDAKHHKNNIAKWTYDDVPTKLWSITPLSKMWGIGSRMEKNLNILNIYTVGDLAKYDPYKLKDKFGVMGLELWNHANGIDLSRISDFKVQAKDKSYSHSQVLFKDYNESNIRIIISEMVDLLCARLRSNNKQTTVIGLGISYSKDIGSGFYHSLKLESPTDAAKEIVKYCNMIFDRYYEFLPIRKVSISCGGLVPKKGVQLNLFENTETIENEEKINEAIDEIKNKFGKNSLIKASSLLPDSTAIERNTKIGGHHE
ncbi:MAG TPA: Y-family DNA polymerase [Candidatus Onthocola stercorigallinarum]|nr:Y-family DNA polymerase [Candidatus Onthocola stercorigallinarum]